MSKWFELPFYRENTEETKWHGLPSKAEIGRLQESAGSALEELLHASTYVDALKIFKSNFPELSKVVPWGSGKFESWITGGLYNARWADKWKSKIGDANASVPPSPNLRITYEDIMRLKTEMPDALIDLLKNINFRNHKTVMSDETQAALWREGLELVIEGAEDPAGALEQVLHIKEKHGFPSAEQILAAYQSNDFEDFILNDLMWYHKVATEDYSEFSH